MRQGCNYSTCKYYCNISTYYLPTGRAPQEAKSKMEFSVQHVYLGVPLGIAPVEGTGGSQDMAQGEVKQQFGHIAFLPSTGRALDLELPPGTYNVHHRVQTV